jgi:hypothetical protein
MPNALAAAEFDGRDAPSGAWGCVWRILWRSSVGPGLVPGAVLTVPGASEAPGPVRVSLGTGVAVPETICAPLAITRFVGDVVRHHLIVRVEAIMA